MTQTWGEATYPLAYVYDAYGQKTELHTYRGGQNWGAGAWPTATTGTADVTKWVYDEATGLVKQKQDAAARACPELCVSGHHNVSGILSAKRIAKRFNAALHSLIGIVHLAVIFCNAR